MTSPQVFDHGSLQPDSGNAIHAPFDFTYADATVRGAASGFTATDLYKIALQKDDYSVWLLIDDSPVTWEQIAGPTLLSSGDLTDLGDVTITGPTTGQVLRKSAGDWVNATLVPGDISGFDTQVRTSTLNQMAAPTADLSINSHKLTNVTDPTAAQDAATKAYVDAFSNGIDWKASVRTATTAALPSYTRTSNVITATANGALAAVDGVTLVANDRLLLKDGAAGADNGVYVVTTVGDGSNPFVLTRSTDADSSAEVTAGLATFVSEGTTNGNLSFVLTTNDPIILNTTALTFTAFSSSATTADHNHTAGAGDGGKLTNDEHDGYSEYVEISDPSSPSSDKLRLYAKDDSGTTKLAYKDSSGTVQLLTTPALGYSDEQAQDAVGTILDDSGDIDFTGDDATPKITAVVKADAVTYSKMQNVSATSRVLGRITAGSGDVEELTAANLKTILDFDEDVQDLVGALLAAGNGITVSYNDAGAVETISVSFGGSGSAVTASRSDHDHGAGASVNPLLTYAFAEHRAQPNNTTVFTIAMTATLNEGTATAADDATGNWIQYVTSNINDAAGPRATSLQYYPDWELIFICRMKTHATTTSLRHLIGMFDTTTAELSDAPANNLVAFRYSTNASDAHWIAMSDSGSGTPETTDTGVSYAASTAYTFRIEFSNTYARFYINDNLVATHASKFPTTLTRLGVRANCENLVGGSARGMLWERFVLLQKK